MAWNHPETLITKCEKFLHVNANVLNNTINQIMNNAINYLWVICSFRIINKKWFLCVYKVHCFFKSQGLKLNSSLKRWSYFYTYRVCKIMRMVRMILSLLSDRNLCLLIRNVDWKFDPFMSLMAYKLLLVKWLQNWHFVGGKNVMKCQLCY